MLKHIRRSLFAAIAATMLWTGTGSAGVTPVGDTSQAQIAQAGERYQGTIVLNNSGAAPVEVKLYQTDYSFSADGRVDYGAPGKLPRSNAHWISLPRQMITIAPNTVERIGYDVKVPAGKDLSGTYWSMIMVEPIAADSAESAGALPEHAIGIKTNLRYGMQIITQLGKSGQAGLAFSNPQLQNESGKRIFTIDVENNGQRWLVPALWLELYKEDGSAVGKFQAAANRLFPGTSVRFRMDLGPIPNGKYLGLVAADGTGDNLFGANVELEAK